MSQKFTHILFSFLFLYSLLISNTLYARERILEYKSTIDISVDGTLEIIEKITVLSEGKKIKRGIFRDFPTKYKDKYGNNVKAGFQVDEVLRNNSPEKFIVQNQSNGKRIRIGSKDVFVQPGKHTYTIKYKTDRQIGFFDGFDELYFNAIGYGWNFEIDRAQITLNLPDKAKILDYIAYTGSRGEKGTNYTINWNNTTRENNSIEFVTIQPLNVREGLTIAVSWPKGIVTEPSQIQKSHYFLQDNAAIIIFILGFIFLIGYYYYAWNKVGRDPEKGTIIPLFNPPGDFSPAAIRYLLQMSFDKRCFTAAIVNMARKGYLDIIDQEDEYTLTKKTDDQSILTKGEIALAKKLFLKSDTITLNNKEHSRFRSAISGLSRALKNELSSYYFNANGKWLIPGLGISIITIISILLFMSDFTLLIIICIGLIVLTNMLFAYLMQAPTLLGRKTMDEIEGFKMYLSIAEAERMNLLTPPERTPELFERFLPYAIALKVENEWGDQFNALFSSLDKENQSYNPSWYHGHYMSRFAMADFTSSIGKSFSSAISSASTPPGSSSGGGGFAGGGGGGGGGGGW